MQDALRRRQKSNGGENMSKRYATRIVAFVDIMGFKEKVNKYVSDNEMAEKIHRTLKQILYLKKRNDEDIKNGYNVSNIRIATFSDAER